MLVFQRRPDIVNVDQLQILYFNHDAYFFLDFPGDSLLGGFTTFSAFSLETLGLIEAGFWYKALINVAVSVLCCVFAAYLGTIAGTLMMKSF